MRVVSGADFGSRGTCQNPEAVSKVEKYYALESLADVSSMVGNG